MQRSIAFSRAYCQACLLQGAFLDNEALNKTTGNLSADDLLELLNTDQSKGDKAQSGVVSDKVHSIPNACVACMHACILFMPVLILSMSVCLYF